MYIQLVVWFTRALNTEFRVLESNVCIMDFTTTKSIVPYFHAVTTQLYSLYGHEYSVPDAAKDSSNFCLDKLPSDSETCSCYYYQACSDKFQRFVFCCHVCTAPVVLPPQDL